jgi:hypothetical protein
MKHSAASPSLIAPKAVVNEDVMIFPLVAIVVRRSLAAEMPTSIAAEHANRFTR